MIRLLLLFSMTFLLVACGGRDTRDLQQELARIANLPGGEVEPLPQFEDYDSFTYNAASMRSPFDLPVTVVPGRDGEEPDPVQPDLDRVREPLEAYSLANLQMVGTLSRGDQMVALVRDPDGGVHRVVPGQYLGRNHGQVERVTVDEIALTEIVPAGDGGWLERPRNLGLSR